MSILLISSLAEAADPTVKNSFIAFNGATTYSNYITFEDRILDFKDNFFSQSNTTILNSTGSRATVVAIDNYGAIIRDYRGEPILKQTSLANSQAANEQNLTQALEKTKILQPNSVTILFTDHGSPEGIVSTEGIISYEKLQKLSDKIDPNTVVRDIHFHCYAGKALSRQIEVKQTSDLLQKYPSNRCGFAAADDNEYSRDTNFLDSEETDPIRPFDLIKNQKPAPSLKNLKTLLTVNRQYSPTPQLTSDYFIKDFSKKICESQKEKPLCEINKSELSQIQATLAITISPYCEKVFQLEKVKDTFNDELKNWQDEDTILNDIKDNVIVDSIKKSHAKEYNDCIEKNDCMGFDALFTKLKETNNDEISQEIEEQFQKYRVDNMTSLKMTANKLSAIRAKVYEKSTLDDYNRYQGREASPEDLPSLQLMRFKYGMDGSDVRKLSAKQRVLAAYSYDNAVMESSRALDNLQAIRKRNYLRLQNEIRKETESLLKTSENKKIKDRYDNIKACENSPINEPITGIGSAR